MDKAQDVIRRYSELQTIRKDYESLWQDIIDYVCPRRYNIDGTKAKGKKVGELMFDTTGPEALNTLAAGLYGYLVSPNLRWFRLKLNRYGLDDIPEVAAWLEACEEVMYWSFGRSNFYSEIYEYFQDGGSIGTATIYSERDLTEGKTVFTTLNPGQVFISCNRYGLVDTVFRRYKLTARKALQEFKDGKLPDAVKQQAEKEKDSETEYVHAVFPRSDVEMYRDGRDYKPTMGVKGMPFESVTVCSNGNVLVKESGYRQNPYAVWRWRVNSEEDYGRSPASDAIVDVLGGNQMARTLLIAGQLAVEPPLNVPEELRGKVRIRPRGYNYYDDRDRVISPIQGLLDRYPIGTDQEKDKRRAIKTHFMTDFFTLLSQAAMEGRELTVPQVMEMQGEKAAMLGPIIGRLAAECLNPIIDRVFELEAEAGNMPPPPDILMQYGGQAIEVDYMGPLAQAQKRLFKTQGVSQSISAISPIAQVRPEVLDIVDFDEVTREILEANGMPTKTIRPTAKVDEIRKARQQQQQAQEQAAMLQQVAQNLPGLTKDVEPDSVLAKVAGAQQ
jgi:hypothetical protein